VTTLMTRRRGCGGKPLSEEETEENQTGSGPEGNMEDNLEITREPVLRLLNQMNKS
jgi:hypothetical protein